MANNEEIGYNIREATSRDYEAVMAIDENIYDGYDHLSKLYHTYMRDPRRICFVLEIDRKVVSMDDGRGGLVGTGAGWRTPGPGKLRHGA